MKKNAKITVSAITAALSVAFMLTSYFPYLTYTIPAVAGLFMIVPLILIDAKWAFASYISSALIIVFVAEPEAMLLYVLFMGYYPILKALIERLKNAILEWPVKLTIFNVAIVVFYNIAVLVMGIPFGDFGDLGKYGVYIFWILSNVVFVLYDLAISNMTVLYIYKVHPKIKKLFKM